MRLELEPAPKPASQITNRSFSFPAAIPSRFSSFAIRLVTVLITRYPQTCNGVDIRAIFAYAAPSPRSRGAPLPASVDGVGVASSRPLSDHLRLTSLFASVACSSSAKRTVGGNFEQRSRLLIADDVRQLVSNGAPRRIGRRH